ncbi:S1 family peptidase [Streptomyces buecherae]|uniref:S1 family peptidase n=1 Tax=Streptomyces buecherae TaxID=2763006 RepID=UPI00164D5D28|nr:serine protease [Streptomyces buecherae]MBC3989096.1 serine protease [Streptomyces buecherae]
MRLRTLLRAALAPALIAAAVLSAQSANAADATPEPTAPSTRIVGGGPASEAYSFMGSMQVNGRHGCGASLIKSGWMVTAAHCVAGQQPGSFRIRIGSSDHLSGGTVASVSQIIRHPRYGQVGPYDIALLRLSQPVANQPISIASTSPVEGTATRLLGWGQTCGSPGCGPAPRGLKELNTRINPDRMCTTNFNSSVELCVYGSRSGTACYGDSGGPALVKEGGAWRLAGATSRAGVNNQICGTGDATVYTDVTAHQQWIAQQTGGLRTS